jgi:CO/xanthine dehydrogenase Mo-binding subunit
VTQAAKKDTAQSPSRLGQLEKIREDLRFVKGGGRYLDDIKLPGLLYVEVLTSPYAHARIKNIDISDASKLKGVRSILTGHDLVSLSNPIPNGLHGWSEGSTIVQYCLAVDRVRYCGEPIAAVAAEDRGTAADALELIRVQYEPLPLVYGVSDATREGATILHEELGSNVVFRHVFDFSEGIEKTMQNCDFIIEGEFRTGRHSGQALETFGCIAYYDRLSERLRYWSNFQYPTNFRGGYNIPFPLKIERDRLNFSQDIDIGGSFGNKTNIQWLAVCALLSQRTEQPVELVESRSLHSLAGGCHAHDRVHDIKLGLKRDGTIHALRLKVTEDIGAYPYIYTPATLLKPLTILNGQYRIENICYEAAAVCTNKCPVGAYRGFGAISAAYPLERMMDRAAKKLGIDPVDFRMKNFIKANEFPYVTPSGEIYDSGSYELQMSRLLEISKYEELRARCKQSADSKKRLGIGITTSVEPGMFTQAAVAVSQDAEVTSTPESLLVRVNADGLVFVDLPFPSSGQSHETYVAQLLSSQLGVSMKDIIVKRLDTDSSPPSIGPAASRLASMLAGAALIAAGRIRNKMIDGAAHLIEARKEDLVYENGAISVKGSPEVRMAFKELARIINNQTHRLPKDMETGLSFSCTFDYRPGVPDEKWRLNRYNTIASGANLALVEVDTETGIVKLLGYWVVDDCGTIVNPAVVDGQVHGGVLQGIEHGIYCEFLYDKEGQLMNSTFMDYLVPSAQDVPSIEVGHVVSPSPTSPLGIKGLGEGGIIWAPSAIGNAIEDALAPVGVRIDECPIRPERLLELMNATCQAAP